MYCMMYRTAGNNRDGTIFKYMVVQVISEIQIPVWHGSRAAIWLGEKF